MIPAAQGPKRFKDLISNANETLTFILCLLDMIFKERSNWHDQKCTRKRQFISFLSSQSTKGEQSTLFTQCDLTVKGCDGDILAV